MSFQMCFSFRQRGREHPTDHVSAGKNKVHRTRNPRGRQCWGSTLATLPFLLRQQEQSEKCFKTLITTEPSLKEIGMCICTCAQVCVHAQMLGSEHRHKGPVKEQPQGEVLDFVSFVCQASWDPSFYRSTGTTSV